jgi:hypothetical protein
LFFNLFNTRLYIIIYNTTFQKYLTAFAILVFGTNIIGIVFKTASEIIVNFSFIKMKFEVL